MQVQQIKRTRVGEQVLNQLLAMIEAGTWQEGEKIPSERELSNSFGVSSTTIRQALQRLNAIGLLETRVGEGSFVKSLTPQTSLDMLRPGSHLNQKGWRDVLEFRQMLEEYAVELAALRATAEDLVFLEDNYNKMISATDAATYSKYDAQFHTYIGKMSQNDMIIKSYELLNSSLVRIILDEIDRMGIRGAEYHRGVIAAMRTHDRQQAKSYMREHLKGLSRVSHPDTIPIQSAKQ